MFTLINVCWKSKGSDEATWISFGSKAQKIEANLPNFIQHHLEASLTGGLQIGKRGTPMVAIHFT
jgi:hypothetical protein